jgi:hypothetical protein
MSKSVSNQDTIRVVWEIDRTELARRGRKGAAATHARHDARTLTAPARAAFLETFMRAVDPHNELDPKERERRAALARQAHFRDLAYRSAAARRAKKQTADADSEKGAA